jgi:hypothetical protein
MTRANQVTDRHRSHGQLTSRQTTANGEIQPATHNLLRKRVLLVT